MTSLHIQRFFNTIGVITTHTLTRNNFVRINTRRNDGLNSSPKVRGVTLSHWDHSSLNDDSGYNKHNFKT